MKKKVDMVNPSTVQDKTSWFPTIDPELCLGDMVCVDFCRNDVFAFDEEALKVVVRDAYNCILGCDACATLCPGEAIRFPHK